MDEQKMSRILRTALTEQGFLVQRVEDRLGGFPDMLVHDPSKNKSFGIETKVWKTTRLPPIDLGLRPMQVAFAERALIPVFLIGLQVRFETEHGWFMFILSKHEITMAQPVTFWRQRIPKSNIFAHCVCKQATLYDCLFVLKRVDLF